MSELVLYLAFGYRGFYSNIFMRDGYWEFEVYVGDGNDICLWGDHIPLTDIAIGELVEVIIGKIDELNSLNYA